MITLPTTPTAPSMVNPKVLVLYGAPKVGKSTILADLPNNLIIDLEDGTDYISSLRVKVHNTDELREVAAELLKAKSTKGTYPYEYVSIDTVTALEDWAEKVATENYKKSPVGKTFTGDSVLTLPNGGGYLWLRLAMAELVGLFSHCTKYLILTGHLRDKVLDKAGVEVATKDIELTGKIRNIMCSRADAIGYLYRKDNKLMISFQTAEGVLCGGRCEHLKGKIMEFNWSTIYV